MLIYRLNIKASSQVIPVEEDPPFIDYEEPAWSPGNQASEAVVASVTSDLEALGYGEQTQAQQDTYLPDTNLNLAPPTPAVLPPASQVESGEILRPTVSNAAICPPVEPAAIKSIMQYVDDGCKAQEETLRLAIKTQSETVSDLRLTIELPAKHLKDMFETTQLASADREERLLTLLQQSAVPRRRRRSER